jgi:hypothetical protein
MTDEGASNGRRLIDDALAARRRAQMVSGLRGLARSPAGARAPAGAVATAGTEASPATDEVCDLCGVSIGENHRHLLELSERRIACSCETCWAMRSGEGDFRPVGSRVLWLAELELPDDLWASFQIPIGLAFFMRSTVTECVVAMYPSPGGATESELHFESWSRMVSLNPVLEALEPDVEGLVVNRLLDPPAYAIAPIDRCYALTGTIKMHWEGISGGDGVALAVGRFFEQLRAEAVVAT